MDLHDDNAERASASHNCFVVPALPFPDMEPDDDIENLARRRGMHVIWGVENLPADLEKIVRSRRVSDRVNMESIAGAVLAVTDGQIRLD